MTTPTTPYLPGEIADLFPNHLSQEFWDRCARRELAFQRCAECKTFRHPPAPICYVCRSFASEWTPCSGRGTVFTYTIVTHPVHPALTGSVPFNIVLVEFPDVPGVRLVSNLVGVEPTELRSGLAVEVIFEEPIPGTVLPRFRLAEG